MNAAPEPWPTELRLHKDRKTLTIAFDSGETFDLAAEYAARAQPERRGAGPFTGRAQDRRPARRTSIILEIRPVGNYAVRLVFDDMHSTGIFSWDYFRDLGRNRDANWQDYLEELAGKGLTR